MDDPITADLERQILATHERFTAAIATRIPHMNREQRERYLALVSTLVGKLEVQEKPLKQVLQECVGELLPIVMQELSS